jgi:hypothetical protein
MSQRQIEPKLVAWIDKKLEGNQVARQALAEKNARLLLIEVSRCFLGVREKTGNNDGEIVELIQETIGGHGREPYCMAGVQTCVAYVEGKLGIKSPIFPTEHVMTCLRETPSEAHVKRFPGPGAIPCWEHGKSDQGHTGIYLGGDEETFHAIEFNTTAGEGANGKVVREGGGVYLTTRSMHGNGDMHIRGWLIPFPLKA